MLLRQYGVTQLVFGGVTTSCCVATTMREASDLGFNCWVLSDCTGDCGAYDYMDTMRLAAGRVLSAEAFLGVVDPRLSASSLALPALQAMGTSSVSSSVSHAVCASANIAAAMADGNTLDMSSLRAKLAADARAFIDTLQQRAADEAAQSDASLRSVVACDGGRTNAWPHEPQAFTPQTTALLCMHVADEEPNGGAPTPPWQQQLGRLVAAATKARVPIFLVGTHAGTRTHPPPPLGMPAPPYPPLRGASRISCAEGHGAFSGTALDAQLRGMGVSNLIITGRGASTAVNTTMRQASDRGYDTLVVADCIGADDDADLWGVTASVIRKAIFSACAHSDALHPWLERAASQGLDRSSSGTTLERLLDRVDSL